MADKATADRVAADMSPPAYRQAVQRIRTITAKKEKVASANGDIADIWAKVEGHKVNKTAGKFFYKLDGLSHEDRMIIMRDLNGLCDAAGWEETAQDLVDAAQGNVVHMRAGKTPKSEEASDDDTAPPASGDAADTAELSSDAADTATAGAEAALKRARKRLSGGATKAPDPSPYTGDNSDLADGAE